MTPHTPLFIDVNDPDNPIQLLGSYRHVEFPVDSRRRTPAWEAALDVTEHNLRVTIRFGGSQAEVLTPETELFDTLMQAKAEAHEALLLVRAAWNASEQDFHNDADRLRAKYASIVGHIRHFFFVDVRHRPLCSFVEGAM